MTTFFLDAGALIGLEKDRRDVWSRLERARSNSDKLIVPTVVLGQVWRGTPQQARLNQALEKCTSLPLDEDTARDAGRLCGRTGTSDVVDAVVAAVANGLLKTGDVSVLTSDPNDISDLLEALDSAARVVPV